jgi:hypothetical protein
MQKKLQLPNFVFSFILPNILVLVMLTVSVIILGWVGILTWTDATVWHKDIGTIFFGSRAGENISLGIGMAVIHYFIIGAALLASGVVLSLRNRIGGNIFATTRTQNAGTTTCADAKTKRTKEKSRVQEMLKPTKNETPAATSEDRFFSGCQHHFGYLSARPKDSPIPPECIICQRLGDCMVATVYVKKVADQ